MYTTKQKQPHRHRKQTSGYHWEKKGGEARQGYGINKIQTTMCKIDKQQRYIIQHRTVQPLFCNNFQRSIIYKNIESLFYIPETNMTL